MGLHKVPGLTKTMPIEVDEIKILDMMADVSFAVIYDILYSINFIMEVKGKRLFYLIFAMNILTNQTQKLGIA